MCQNTFIMEKPNDVKPFISLFISALKSSKVDGISEIQRSLLFKNCRSCYLQISKLLDPNSSLYEEFRFNSTLLLLCCSKLLKHDNKIAKSSQLIPLVQSAPELLDSDILFIIKGLKNHRYLSGILPWLPPHLIINFFSLFMMEYSISELSLVINCQFMKALLHSIFFNTFDSNKIYEVFVSFKSFLNFEFLNCGKESKLSAYYYTCILEIFYDIYCILSDKNIKEPVTYPYGLILKNLFKSKCNINNAELKSNLYGFLKDLLTIINKNSAKITTNVWIEWHEFSSIPFQLSKTKTTKINSDKSMQIQIANKIYEILDLNIRYDSKLISGSTSTYDNSKDPFSESPEKFTEVQLHLKDEFPELYTFFQQVAVDPDFDPDTKRGNNEIIKLVNKNEDPEKCNKLLSILLEKDENWKCEKCFDCVKSYSDFENELVKKMFVKLVEKSKRGEKLLEWKMLILDFCKQLPALELLRLLEIELDSGKTNLLKSDNFDLELTKLFNQLADNSKEKSLHLYLWLCLQSSSEVIQQSIKMAIQLPGIIPPLIHAFSAINFVCTSSTVSGCSLLITLLKEELIKITKENELLNMQSLIVGIIASGKISKISPSLKSENTELEIVDIEKRSKLYQQFNHFILNTSEENVLEVLKSNCALNSSELFNEILSPEIFYQEDFDYKLIFILEIFKELIVKHESLIFISNEKISTSLACMILLHTNCCVFGDVSNLQRRLHIRMLTEDIFKLSASVINESSKDYSTEILSFKNLLSGYEVHLRSLILVSNHFDCEAHICLEPFEDLEQLEAQQKHDSPGDQSKLSSTLLEGNLRSFSDVIFYHIVQSAQSNRLRVLSNVPSNFSRIKWTWALYQILPSCDSSEWYWSMQLTQHQFFTDVKVSHKLEQMLQIFANVLQLICLSNDSEEVSLETDQLSESDVHKTQFISLEWCFKNFSNAALRFTKNYLAAQSDLFKKISDIFIWWTCLLKTFSCEPTLPCIFLSSVATMISDLVRSKIVQIIDKSRKNFRRSKRRENPSYTAKKIIVNEDLNDDSALDLTYGSRSNSQSSVNDCTADFERIKGETNNNHFDEQFEEKIVPSSNIESQNDGSILNFNKTNVNSQESSDFNFGANDVESISREKYIKIVNDIIMSFVDCIPYCEISRNIASKIQSLILIEQEV